MKAVHDLLVSVQADIEAKRAGAQARRAKRRASEKPALGQLSAPQRPRLEAKAAGSLADGSGLPIGYRSTSAMGHAASGAGLGRAPIGFMAPAADVAQLPWNFSGDGHLLTVGPTGSGKTRCSAIPALLSHPGSMIVTDPKGELFHTTARYRRRLGQRVARLDPFGLVRLLADTLNPLDVLRMAGMDRDDAALTVASLLLPAESIGLEDPFWIETATDLLAGLVAHWAGLEDAKERRLSALRELFSDDTTYRIAVMLDAKVVHSKLADQSFRIFLQTPQEPTGGCIRSTAQTAVRLFGTDAVRRATDTSTVDLQALVDGEPMTIYIVFPPSRLTSHRALLRVWLGSLLMALSLRKHKVNPPTLLLVDEAAQLGPMPLVEQAVTLLRGYGVQTWQFWQDLGQIKQCYPHTWETLVNNAQVVQLLPPNNLRMAKGYAELLGGISAEQLLAMLPDEQAVIAPGVREPLICRRVDYLSDARFAGLFDRNERIANGR